MLETINVFYIAYVPIVLLYLTLTKLSPLMSYLIIVSVAQTKKALMLAEFEIGLIGTDLFHQNTFEKA